MARKRVDPALADKLGRSFPPGPNDVGHIYKGGVDSPDMAVDKAGRPFAIKDKAAAIATLRGLGSIQATSKECAAVLGVTERTLFKFFERVPEAKDAWDSGKLEGKTSLRRSQMKLAERNATMAIFLGLNYLDQKDRRVISGDMDAPIKHEHTHAGTVRTKVDYSKLPLDQLVDLHRQKTRAKR